MKVFFLVQFFGLMCLCSATTGNSTCEDKKNDATILVLLGHPGSGKGTFAEALRDQNVIHISLGDFLRSEFRKQSDIGIRWKREVETFGILSIEVVKEVTADLIKTISSGTGQVYILDGHVRMREQAEYLDNLLNMYENIQSFFIYIDIDQSEALRRIPNRRTCEKCSCIYNCVSHPPMHPGICDYCEGNLVRRDTDNEVHAKNRIITYTPHLEEVVEYYRAKSRLVEFNGNLPIHICSEHYQMWYACHRNIFP